MAWELDGRVGLATIAGHEREGVCWMRDRQKGLVAFHALPPRSSFDPTSSKPPVSEQNVIPESEFRGVWPKRSGRSRMQGDRSRENRSSERS